MENGEGSALGHSIETSDLNNWTVVYRDQRPEPPSKSLCAGSVTIARSFNAAPKPFPVAP